MCNIKKYPECQPHWGYVFEVHKWTNMWWKCTASNEMCKPYFVYKYIKLSLGALQEALARPTLKDSWYHAEIQIILNKCASHCDWLGCARPLLSQGRVWVKGWQPGWCQRALRLKALHAHHLCLFLHCINIKNVYVYTVYRLSFYGGTIL